MTLDVLKELTFNDDNAPQSLNIQLMSVTLVVLKELKSNAANASQE